MHEVLATSMEKLSGVMIFYLQEDEIRTLIGWLLSQITNASATIRRSSSESIGHLCAHSPVPIVDYVLVQILQKFQSTVDTPLDVDLIVADGINMDLLLGTLNACHCLLKLSEGSHGESFDHGW